MEVDYSWEKRVEFDWLVSSMGGVGSTALMKYLENFVRINPTGFHVGTSRFKHARWPDPGWNINGAIFIYGDPRDATISLFNRVLVHSHLINMRIPKRKLMIKDEVQAGPNFNGSSASIENYLELGEDIFLFEEMINNWIDQPTPFPKMLIKHEILYDYPDKILNFLNCDISTFKNSFPKKKSRNSNWNDHPQSEKLTNLFSSLLEKINNLPPVLEIPARIK